MSIHKQKYSNKDNWHIQEFNCDTEQWFVRETRRIHISEGDPTIELPTVEPRQLSPRQLSFPTVEPCMN